MIDKVLLLFGTQSGTAAMVADMLGAALERQGIATEMAPEHGADPDLLARHRWLLVCCSSHGEGDVPDHLLPLLEALREQRPDLTGLRHGVVSLGDRTYSDTFCFGGRRVDEALQALGAVRIGDRLEIDASAQPFADEVALAWLPEWLALARRADAS